MIGKTGRPADIIPRIRKGLITLVILAAIGAIPAGIGQAVVYISNLAAYPGDHQVTIRWTVDAQASFAGFFVRRNTEETGTFTRLNPIIIPLKPGDFFGSDYEYIDNTVTNGVLYWYQLEVINNNQLSEFEEPICAVPGQEETNCPDFLTPTTNVSASPSRTSTPTATQKTGTVTTSANATATRTSTPTPTRTSASSGLAATTLARTASLPTNTRPAGASTLPGNALTPSPTFVDASIPLPVAALTVTTTLASLPTVQLIFPTPAEESPAEVGALVLDPTAQPVEPETTGQDRRFLIVIVIVIWLALGAWYIFLFRRVG